MGPRVVLTVILTFVLFVAPLAALAQPALGLTIPPSILARADQIIE